MEKFFDKRKEYVARFLQSYLTRKQLSEVAGFDEDEDMTTAGNVELVPSHPFDRELAAGQIRLLSQTERISYVVLLRRWERNSFVVMPFSAFNVPGTNEEFVTEYDGGLYQRVLQIWNTRTLQDASLKKSWLVGELPPQDLKDAWRLWEASLGGKEAEDRLVEKTALPIYHTDDPRLEYKREELKNFAKLDAEDLALAEKCPVLDFSLFVPETALAAGREKENLQFHYTLEGGDVVCFVEYSWHDRQLSVYVNTPDGKVSCELDGCRLCEEAGHRVLGIIDKGKLRVAYMPEPESKLLFLDKEGKELDGDFEEIVDD